MFSMRQSQKCLSLLKTSWEERSSGLVLGSVTSFDRTSGFGLTSSLISQGTPWVRYKHRGVCTSGSSFERTGCEAWHWCPYLIQPSSSRRGRAGPIALQPPAASGSLRPPYSCSSPPAHTPALTRLPHELWVTDLPVLDQPKTAALSPHL